MADMDAAAARYETLGEEADLVPNTKGHTTASAAAAQAKWGKNEIPEDKEPLWRLFAMQFVGAMPAMVRYPAPLCTFGFTRKGSPVSRRARGILTVSDAATPPRALARVCPAHLRAANRNFRAAD